MWTRCWRLEIISNPPFFKYPHKLLHPNWVWNMFKDRLKKYYIEGISFIRKCVAFTRQHRDLFLCKLYWSLFIINAIHFFDTKLTQEYHPCLQAHFQNLRVVFFGATWLCMILRKVILEFLTEDTWYIKYMLIFYTLKCSGDTILTVFLYLIFVLYGWTGGVTRVSYIPFFPWILFERQYSYHDQCTLSSLQYHAHVIS